MQERAFFVCRRMRVNPSLTTLSPAPDNTQTRSARSGPAVLPFLSPSQPPLPYHSHLTPDTALHSVKLCVGDVVVCEGDKKRERPLSFMRGQK